MAPVLLDHSKFSDGDYIEHHFKTVNVAFNLCEICIKTYGIKVNNVKTIFINFKCWLRLIVA